MAQTKTLQVLVSSTSIDWQEERPAAVEALRTASPMRADMEPFTVGDQSQRHVMQRWIEASTIPCRPCRGGVEQCQEKRDDAS